MIAKAPVPARDLAGPPSRGAAPSRTIGELRAALAGRAPSRATLRWASVALALLAAGCRTTAPRPASTASCPTVPPPTVYLSSSPALLVAKGQLPFLVLESTLSVVAGGPATFRLSFLAASDAAAARSGDASERLTSTGAILLDTLTPVLPAAVHAAELTALFGEPGGRGVAVPVRFERSEQLWNTVKVAAPREVIVPALSTPVSRAKDGEDAAVRAARTFLERADDGDEDGAWDLASAIVKATSSRNEFVDQLRATNPPAARRERRERFYRYDARPGVLRIGDVVEVCFDTPVGVDTLQVRLDDDQEWRVAFLAHRDVRPPDRGGRTALGTAPGQTARP